jgi:hypothetical protein
MVESSVYVCMVNQDDLTARVSEGLCVASSALERDASGGCAAARAGDSDPNLWEGDCRIVRFKYSTT